MPAPYEPSFAKQRERQAKEKIFGKGGLRMIQRSRRRVTEAERELEEFSRKAAQAIQRGYKLNPW